MHAAEDWAREKGAAIVQVETFLASPSSTPFYEQRMGYSKK